MITRRQIDQIAAAERSLELLAPVLIAEARPEGPGPYPRQPDEFYPTFYAIARLVKPRRIAEIGMWWGYSAWCFVRGALDAGIPREEILVSGWDNESYPGASSCLDWVRECLLAQRIAYNVAHAEMKQFESLPLSYIDLFNVDGEHTYKGAARDLRLAHPTVRPGGVILLDDIGHNHEIRKAGEEFLEEFGYEPLWIANLKGLLVMTKPMPEPELPAAGPETV